MGLLLLCVQCCVSGPFVFNISPSAFIALWCVCCASSVCNIPQLLINHTLEYHSHTANLTGPMHAQLCVISSRQQTARRPDSLSEHQHPAKADTHAAQQKHSPSSLQPCVCVGVSPAHALYLAYRIGSRPDTHTRTTNNAQAIQAMIASAPLPWPCLTLPHPPQSCCGKMCCASAGSCCTHRPGLPRCLRCCVHPGPNARHDLQVC